MDKFGIILPRLGHNQEAYYAIRECNRLVSERSDLAPYIFFEDVNRPTSIPKFAVMHVNEIWGFNAPVVATSLTSGAKLKNAIGPTRKILYLQNLEWIYGQFSFEWLYENLTGYDSIIARSVDHKKAIESIFNLPVEDIVEDFSGIHLCATAARST